MPTPPPIAPAAPAPVSETIVALRTEIATMQSANDQASARADTERRLLRKEVEAEWSARLDGAQRDAQSALVHHLYEKQDLMAKHHKALQRAEFDRLDMLAQQEARAKLREVMEPRQGPTSLTQPASHAACSRCLAPCGAHQIGTRPQPASRASRANWSRCLAHATLFRRGLTEAGVDLTV